MNRWSTLSYHRGVAFLNYNRHTGLIDRLLNLIPPRSPSRRMPAVNRRLRFSFMPTRPEINFKRDHERWVHVFSQTFRPLDATSVPAGDRDQPQDGYVKYFTEPADLRVETMGHGRKSWAFSTIHQMPGASAGSSKDN